MVDPVRNEQLRPRTQSANLGNAYLPKSTGSLVTRTTQTGGYQPLPLGVEPTPTFLNDLSATETTAWHTRTPTDAVGRFESESLESETARVRNRSNLLHHERLH